MGEPLEPPDIERQTEDIALFADAYARRRLDPKQRGVMQQMQMKIDEATRGDGNTIVLPSASEMSSIIDSVEGGREVIGVYQSFVKEYTAKMN